MFAARSHTISLFAVASGIARISDFLLLLYCMCWDLVGSNSCCICMWFHFIMDSHSEWLWIPSSWLCSVGRSLTAHAILPGRKSLESRWGAGWYRIAPWQLGDYVRLACICFRMMAHRTRHYEKMPSYIASAFIGRYGSFDDTSSCGGLAAAFVSYSHVALCLVQYNISLRPMETKPKYFGI